MRLTSEGLVSWESYRGARVPDDDLGIDVAREHDEYLAATEIASWSASSQERGEP